MAAGICGSDIPRIFETGTYHFPTIPGHEFSGRVAEVYRGESDLTGWLGKRVGVFPLIPCRECEPCRNRQYEMCQHYNYLGSRCDGGFAEYVAVPVWNLIPLPDEVSYEEAALLEPASVALHAARRLDLTGVQSVALFGLGTIGILIAEWLFIMGVPRVFATGHSAHHGSLMKSVTSEKYEYLNIGQNRSKHLLLRPYEHDSGVSKSPSPEAILNGFANCNCSAPEQLQKAADWILQQTDGKGADVVIDCVADSGSLADAFLAARAGGQLLEVGNPKGDMQLSRDVYWKLLRKQLRVTGTWNSSYTQESGDDWHTVLSHCADGSLKLRELITHLLPFDALDDGLRIMRDKTEYHNKVMIVKNLTI
jgi:L-iditol 2-dehydrogenase